MSSLARQSRIALFVMLTALTSQGGIALATQNQSSPTSATSAGAKREEINLDVQLHLLLASENPGGTGNLPQSMDAVVKQLKSSLSFTNFRLVTTFINRVKDGGNLSVSGVGGLAAVAGVSPNNQTFYNFKLSPVRLVTDSADQQFVQIPRFTFGMRIPVVTGTTKGDANNPSMPIIQYEQTGMDTEVSMREGAPTVIGTITTSRPNELYILVVSAKRTPTR